MIQTNDCQWFLARPDAADEYTLTPAGPAHPSVPEAEAWLLANLSNEKRGTSLVLLKCFRHVSVVEKVTLEVKEVSGE